MDNPNRSDFFIEKFNKWGAEAIKAAVDSDDLHSYLLRVDESFWRDGFPQLVEGNAERKAEIESYCRSAIKKHLQSEGAQYLSLSPDVIATAVDEFFDTCSVIEFSECWPIPGQQLTIDESQALIALIKETHATLSLKHDGEVNPNYWETKADKTAFFTILYKASYLLIWQPFKQYLWIMLELGPLISMYFHDFLPEMAKAMIDAEDPQSDLFEQISKALLGRDRVFSSAFRGLFNDPDLPVDVFFDLPLTALQEIGPFSYPDAATGGYEVTDRGIKVMESFKGGEQDDSEGDM